MEREPERNPETRADLNEAPQEELPTAGPLSPTGSEDTPLTTQPAAPRAAEVAAAQVRRSLCAHGGRRFYRGDIAVDRLVGSAACSDVENRPRRSERGVNASRDAWIRLTVAGISTTDRSVVGIAGAPVTLSREHALLDRVLVSPADVEVRSSRSLENHDDASSDWTM